MLALAHKARPPFSSWAGPRNPKTLILGEAFGEYEDQMKSPFVWESGKELWRMLGEAWPSIAPDEHHRVSQLLHHDLAWVRHREDWLHEASLAFTNTLNLRPPANKIPDLCIPRADLPPSYTYPPLTNPARYLHPQYLPELDRLQSEITQSNPNLIIAMGNTACWATLSSIKISSIRGAIAPSTLGPWKVLPTYHPASVLYQWSWRAIVIADLMKALHESQFPEIRRPHRLILINPTYEELYEWTQKTLADAPSLLSLDTETEQGQIKCISFAVEPHTAVSIPFKGPSGDSYWKTTEQETQVWLLVKALVESPIPKLFQNGIYDLQYLNKMGFRTRNVLEDTMLLHHSLYPEVQKGLGFLGSVYTNELAWKLMRRHKPDTEKRDE